MAESTMSRVLDLGPNGVFTFTSVDDVGKWVQDEQTAWEWLGGYQTDLWGRYRHALKNLRNNVPQVLESEVRWAELVATVKPSYESLIHAQSVEGQFVLSLQSQQGNEVALGALGAMMPASLTGITVSANLLRGYILGVLLDRGLPEAAMHTASAVEKQKHGFQDWWEDARELVQHELLSASEANAASSELRQRISAELTALHEKAKADLEEAQRRHREEIIVVKGDFDRKTKSFDDRMDALLKKNEETMKATEDTYRQKLALQESVTYWRNKKTSHRTKSIVFGVLFPLALVAGMGIVFWMLNHVDNEGQPLIPREVDWQKFPLSRVLLVGVVITGLLWIIQTLARLFFSNLHLYTDADERVVMVTTYLALMKEEKALEPTDRKLVIETLFRHASTGVMREDAHAPIILNKILNKD